MPNSVYNTYIIYTFYSCWKHFHSRSRHHFWKRHDIQYFRVWRNTLFMMTSSNGNIFHVTGPMCGEFSGHGEFPSQRPVTRSSDIFFDLCVNTWLSKQWRRRWLETPTRSLWRHRNVFVLPASSPTPCGLHYVCEARAQHQLWCHKTVPLIDITVIKRAWRCYRTRLCGCVHSTNHWPSITRMIKRKICDIK